MKFDPSRRTFIKTLLPLLVTSGCASDQNEQSGWFTRLGFGASTTPTATVQPRPTPTTLPRPTTVVQTYLDAWARGDFGTMYHLLSPESQQFISQAEFIAAYQHALQQTTALDIQLQMGSLLTENDQATALFQSIWQTVLFDDISAEHKLHLRFDQHQARWVINWRHHLILPQLDLGITLMLITEDLLRGNIYDLNGQALANHGQAVTIGAIPEAIEDEAKVITTISFITKLPADVVRNKLKTGRPDWFIPIADISFETSVKYYNQLYTLPGVETRAYPIRAYPHDSLAAHLIGLLGNIPFEQLDSYQRQGYRGDELIGLSGIEAWGERFLAGKRGGRLITVSPAQQILSEIAQTEPKSGGQVYLSLDITLQAQAEQALEGRRGAIVMMRPDGFIIVLATYPRFSPNDFVTGIQTEIWDDLLNNPERPLLNRATHGLYPPGSIFKIISCAAALESLGYAPEQAFRCTGTWQGLGPDFVKTCWKQDGHGHITLKDGLTQSCNVVFYEIGKALHLLDSDALPEMARNFGLDQPTQLMGLNDLGGVIPDETWAQAVYGQPFRIGDAVNMAIGQGDILVTPLQITHFMAAIASDGLTYRPQVIQSIRSKETGEQVFHPENTGQLPINPHTLRVIQESLFNVAQGHGGTSRAVFADTTFTVAGKTGTAETAFDQPHAWFTGYTPTKSPEIVITVVLENAGEGSKEAAPIFKDLAEAYFRT